MANVTISSKDISTAISNIRVWMTCNVEEDTTLTLIFIRHNNSVYEIVSKKLLRYVGFRRMSRNLADIIGAADIPPDDVMTLIEITHSDIETWIQSEKFYRRYLLMRNLDDIHQAVICARALLDLAGPETPIGPILRYNLGRPLLRRFQHTRQVEDISEAIEMFRNAYQPLRDDSAARQKCFAYLSIAYLERDGNVDGVVELNAPDVHRQTRPSNSLETLTHDLDEDDEVFDYFWVTHMSQASFQDRNSEIQACRQALEFFSHHPARAGTVLCQLGSHLMKTSAKQSENINMAIDSFCVALELLVPTCEIFRTSVLLASLAYEHRFLRLRRRKDLDNAIRFAKRAMKLFSSQHPRFGQCSGVLGQIMGIQYESTGDANDLDAAIKYTSRGVDAVNPRMLRGNLYALAHLLLCRSLINGREEDISEAIAAAQRALDLTLPEDPYRGGILAKLSDCEFYQFQKLRDREYLERALRHGQQARSIYEEAHDVYCGEDQAAMNSIHSFKANMFGVPREKEGLDRLIATARHGTLLASASGGGAAFGCCNILFESLFARWKETHRKDDLDEAISVAQRTIELANGRREFSVATQERLGKFLYHRYNSSGNDEDLKEALAVLQEAFQTSTSIPTFRISAGQLAVDILSDRFDWVGARQLCRKIIDLCLIPSGRSLSWQDKQFWLRQYSHRAATYVSVALEAGSDVLDVIDMLETCRGSILGHLIDGQTDIDDLLKVDPEKAQLFETLRNELNIVISAFEDTSTRRVTETTRRIQAEGEFRDCLEEIRKLEGFHRFLSGPSKEVFEAAAAQGPIIIVNITSIRSDAIIITTDRSLLLTLPDLKYEKVKEYIDADLTNFSFKDIGRKNKKYRQLQEWLWDNCVNFIFEKLDNLGAGSANGNSSKKFHIWWIPIGIASSLPFHAAGIYSGNNGETALSRAISSYTPTLKILIHGRQKLRVSAGPPKLDLQRLTIEPGILKAKPRLAVIIMPSTPGRHDLEGVRREAEEIEKLVQDAYSSEILPQPSAEVTVAHMAKCEIVHFACHGESTVLDPSSSSLLLQTTTQDSESIKTIIDKLTLRDVAAAEISHGKLAFLSACSTAQNKFPELWDEVLHLASGFHVAGYLHAIGNLWPSDDEVSVELVRGFYEHLIALGEFDNGDKVGEALNKATINVAKKYARQPLCWAQFVHFGI